LRNAPLAGHKRRRRSITDAEARARLVDSRDKFAIPPDAIARAIALAIEQPADVDEDEIVIRPTAPG
jgi:NADP-dependent 3-hydroxy acid dehydrogenase YdfG